MKNTETKRKQMKANRAFVISNGVKDTLVFRDANTNELIELKDNTDTGNILKSKWAFSNQPIIIN